MERTIVGVNYKNKLTGEYDGRAYSYFCELLVAIGDIVLAPTVNGDSLAKIVQVDIPESSIDAQILPRLKTITSFGKEERPATVAAPNKVDGSDMEKDIITVKQLPVIEERLKSISDQIKARTKEALSLACTEDTVKHIKTVRTELTKSFNVLEAQRKAVKNAIMAPYDVFNDSYRTYVTDVFTPADAELKKRIDEVEAELKSRKREDVITYFDEYAKSKSIGFLTFENAGIQVSMTASLKSLKDQAKQFIDKVVEDLALIETQEFKEEILVEYKKTLNASTAITTVCSRHAAIDAEKRRREEAAAEQARRAESAKSVQEVVREEEPIIAPPTVNPVPVVEKASADDRVYTASFTVRGSLESLKALKEFLANGGYDYESI